MGNYWPAINTILIVLVGALNAYMQSRNGGNGSSRSGASSPDAVQGSKDA